MRNKFLLLVLILSFLFAKAHPVQREEPPTYEFSIQQNASSISMEDVQTLIQILRSEFAAELSGPSWQMDFDWTKPFLAAGSYMENSAFHIVLWGGMVRAKFMTPGALTAILCHELGHRLAGAPYQQFPGSDSADWSSAEGQSDHFAATVCLPRMYHALLKNKVPLLSLDSEPAARHLCEHREPADRLRCEWVLSSGVAMFEVLQVYYDRDIPFAEPLRSAVEEPPETLRTAYPSYQCRMDTMVQGALCDRGLSCARPRCWYKEKVSPN